VKIRNVHERTLEAREEEIARVVASLSSERDQLWPAERWPRMRLQPGLEPGARGGHGPIRYMVEEVTPRRVVFRLTPPLSGFAAGLQGSHRFEIQGNTLRHVLEGEAHGLMLLRWLLVVRPLHDALVEDAFDQAEKSLTGSARRSPHSLWVRLVRAVLRKRRPQSPADQRDLRSLGQPLGLRRGGAIGADEARHGTPTGHEEKVMIFEVRHISVSINRPPEQVYGFASRIENLPRWATGLGQSLRSVNGEWIADSPMGRVKIRFAERNDFGVLDHDVILESGAAIHNPLRVVPNGTGSEVIFTLFRRPGVSEEKFAEDAKWVAKDLGILKGLLE
jgi:hypothetical protein